MKIKQHKHEIDNIKSVILNKNLSYPILDFKSLCYFINYRTHNLNGLYLKLLPTKINDLKVLKNQLLNSVSTYNLNIEEIQQTLYFKNHLFKRDFPKEFKQLFYIINKDLKRVVYSQHKYSKEEQQYLKIKFKHIKKQFSKVDTENLLNIYIKKFNTHATERNTDRTPTPTPTEQNINNSYEYKNFIYSLKYSIKQIDKKIKQYQKDLKNNVMLFDFKINAFDIEQLNKIEQNAQNTDTETETIYLTDNLKKVYHYYIIKLLRTKVSRKAHLYLNSVYAINDTETISIKDILKNYSQYSTIKKDFGEMIKTDLITFENRFLNRTI